MHSLTKNIPQVLWSVSMFWELKKPFWKKSSLVAICVSAAQGKAVTVHNWIGKHWHSLKDATTAEKWTEAEKDLSGNGV